MDRVGFNTGYIMKIIKDLRSCWPRVYQVVLSVSSWIYSFSSHQKIKGKGNCLKASNSFLKKCRFDIRGNNNRIEIGPECRLNRVTFFIRGDDHLIRIESGVRISQSALLWCEDEKGTLTIGEHSHISEVHIAVTEPGSKIEIGSRCLFSSDIEIRCGDSHSILDIKTNKRINRPANVKVGDRVWIGQGGKILKGVEIGSDSVVATGAVVVKSVPAESVVAGNPAKVVRQGIRWTYERLQDCF